MKKNYVSYFAIIVSISFSNYVYALPMNLDCAKQAVINYYESGEFEKEVKLVVQDAENFLQNRVKENQSLKHPHQLAIVLDIDDTSVSHYLHNKKTDFNHLRETIDANLRATDAPAIKPVLQLYNDALNHGVSVFFISLRPDDIRSQTIMNLEKSGFYNWSGLYLPTWEEKKLPAEVYKTSVRQMLYKQGYDIILSMGDQDSDLIGGYAEKVEKIPNPLYSLSKQSCF